LCLDELAPRMGRFVEDCLGTRRAQDIDEDFPQPRTVPSSGRAARGVTRSHVDGVRISASPAPE
jgi:hypothetical protein